MSKSNLKASKETRFIKGMTYFFDFSSMTIRELTGHTPLPDHPYTVVFMDIEKLQDFEDTMCDKLAGVPEYLDGHTSYGSRDNFWHLCNTLADVNLLNGLEDENYEDIPVAYLPSNWKSKQARARKREIKARKRAHLIGLASDNVYLESKKLARHSGVVYRKTTEAEKALANHRLALDLFQKQLHDRCLCPKDIDFMSKNWLGHSKRNEYLKTAKRGRKLVNQAEIYRDHVVFLSKQGAYFKSNFIKAAPLNDVEYNIESSPVKSDGTTTQKVVIIKHSPAIRYINRPMKVAVFH